MNVQQQQKQNTAKTLHLCIDDKWTYSKENIQTNKPNTRTFALIPKPISNASIRDTGTHSNANHSKTLASHANAFKQPRAVDSNTRTRFNPYACAPESRTSEPYKAIANTNTNFESHAHAQLAFKHNQSKIQYRRTLTRVNTNTSRSLSVTSPEQKLLAQTAAAAAIPTPTAKIHSHVNKQQSKSAGSSVSAKTQTVQQPIVEAVQNSISNSNSNSNSTVEQIQTRVITFNHLILLFSAY